jgi:NAD+-dependent protein deacetylase sirtuin 6
MSAGYAERLSAYPHKGVVGLPESFDSTRSVKIKVNRLVDMVKKSQHVVILTGAGISTSSGISDFRGPNGIWTREEEARTGKFNKWSSSSQTLNSRKRRKIHDESSISSNTTTTTLTCLSQARPTLTHSAITRLAHDGKVKYVITQNVDGLHRRSGLSRHYHSSVHGCVFTTKCYNCGTELFGDVDTGGLSFQPTGQKCPEDDCGGPLHDMLLDWEDTVLDMDRAEIECEKADLVICLGTSLRIEPVGSLPLKANQFVVVNLQATPHDESAALIIRARVDDVMDRLMTELGYSEDWKNSNDANVDTDAAPVVIERRWKPSDIESVKMFQKVVQDSNERRKNMTSQSQVKTNVKNK